uniref:Uncharacterized protein n=1 Tax=Hordeum vulgare subsp. vulgare TaxID=112509 RepID=A0A8I6X248_HORVV
MPNGEDPMPLNGNPHPLPGQLVNDHLLFAVPPYPALGWNAVPPPPPKPEPEAPVVGGWGWEPEAPEPEPQPDAPTQDQESMVIDQPTSSDSVQELVVLDPQPAAADTDVVDMPVVQPAADEAAAPDPTPPNGGDATTVDNAKDDEPVEADHAEEAPVFHPLAIVPYQQPLMQQTNLVVGAARVFYGPPLPPVISWARSFESLMGVACTMHVPRHIQMPPVLPIMIPKRSWSSAFDDEVAGSSLAPIEIPPAPSTEVAHDISLPTTEEFSFSSPSIKKKASRKQATPIVDSLVRRCTRGSIKQDGFKPVLQEFPMHVPKKRKPKAKPMDDPVGEQAQEEVPPATPVPILQATGQKLGIAAEKLCVDRLMEDPAESKTPSTDV